MNGIRLLWNCALTGLISIGCESQTQPAPANSAERIQTTQIDSTPQFTPYSGLTFQRQERVIAGPGTKSVIFNQDRTRLYAMNLEAMSVSEFDRSTRTALRQFQFEPTKGKGWDYTAHRSIPSWQEKPVEAWLTKNDRILWVSLHNAAGIVPIRLDTLEKNTAAAGPYKRIRVIDAKRDTTSIAVPLILTGATPKVISATTNQQHLLVSNWHGLSVSVLDLQVSGSPYAKPIRNIQMPAIPRGMVSDPKRQKTYVAIMGGKSLAVIDEKKWTLDTLLPIDGSPRHILQDSKGRLLISYNAQARLVCVDPDSGKTLFSIGTAAQPRTIALSKNESFVFVTGYSSDRLEVFKMHADRFERIASLPCPGHPVGVDLFENNQVLEAWVCSYTTGDISIFNFSKKTEAGSIQ